MQQAGSCFGRYLAQDSSTVLAPVESREQCCMRLIWPLRHPLPQALCGETPQECLLHNYTHNLRKVCEAISSVPVFHSRLQKGVQLTAIRDRVNWSMLQRAHGVQPGAMCPRLHLRHREGRERGLRGRCGGAGRLWRQDGGGCHGKGRKRPGRRGRGRRGGPPLHTRIET